MVEAYCIYELSTNQIYQLCDTKGEALSEVRFANVFRKMLKKEPLMAGKASLTEDEYKALKKMGE